MTAIDDTATTDWATDFATDFDGGLAGLIADAARVQLPSLRRVPIPRAPRVVIDLTGPTPQRTITIPDSAAGLVEGFTDYGA